MTQRWDRRLKTASGFLRDTAFRRHLRPFGPHDAGSRHQRKLDTMRSPVLSRRAGTDGRRFQIRNMSSFSSLVDMLRHQAQHTPDKRALVFSSGKPEIEPELSFAGLYSPGRDPGAANRGSDAARRPALHFLPVRA